MPTHFKKRGTGIPVSVAREIGQTRGMGMVVVLGVAGSKVHTSTWGEGPEKKEDAARFRDTICATMLGGNEPYGSSRLVDDYRHLPEGLHAQRVDALAMVIRKLLALDGIPEHLRSSAERVMREV